LVSQILENQHFKNVEMTSRLFLGVALSAILGINLEIKGENTEGVSL
jgi:hypothetical protein